MSSNKKTLIDGDFQVGSAHFYVDVDNNRVGLNQANPTSNLDVNGNAFIATDMTVASNVTVGSNVIAQKFTGSASGLTSVPADQISGVIPIANGGTGTTTTTGTGSLVKSDNPTFTGTVTADTFSGSGASLTNIPMGEATGTLAVANGGTGVTTSTGSGNTVLSASPTLTGTVTAEIANFSSNISASNIYAGRDTDMTSYLGRAAVGFSGVSDEATFSHVDVNSTNNYALKQSATGGTQVNAATGEAIIFSINDSEQARINTTGLGVGIDVPGFKLDVDGTANVGALTCTTVQGDGYLLSNIAGYSWPTHLNGNDIYYTTGNVGIGTATPDNTLEVAGTASVAILKSAADAATSTYNYILNGPRPGTTSDGAVHFINGSTRTTDGGTNTYTIRNNNGNLLLGNASYDTLLEGNVGIGEDTPLSKLVVNGDIDIKNGNLKTNGTDAIFSNWATDTNGINRTGNVGIGGDASATNALKVHGTVEATGFTGNGTSTFGSDGLLHINSRSSQYGSETVGLQTTIDGRALTEADPGTHGGEYRHVLALQPDGGFVGIGTTNPRDPLTIRPAATTGEGIHSGICIDHDTGHANAKRGLAWHNTNQDFEMGAIRMEVGGNYNSCKMSFFTSASKATAIERMTLDHIGNLVASGDVTASSDRRLKTDIKRIDGALNKVRTLGGYTFTKNDNSSTGLIAQEVLEVLPEAVHGTEETYYSIAYGNMVGILIEAIKELSDEVKELKEKIG